MNNTSIFTADRTTHLMIVVAGTGIAARMTDGPTSGSRLEASVIRAGTPVTASNGGIVIR